VSEDLGKIRGFCTDRRCERQKNEVEGWIGDAARIRRVRHVARCERSHVFRVSRDSNFDVVQHRLAQGVRELRLHGIRIIEKRLNTLIDAGWVRDRRPTQLVSLVRRGQRRDSDVRSLQNERHVVRRRGHGLLQRPSCRDRREQGHEEDRCPQGVREYTSTDAHFGTCTSSWMVGSGVPRDTKKNAAPARAAAARAPQNQGEV